MARSLPSGRLGLDRVDINGTKISERWASLITR